MLIYPLPWTPPPHLNVINILDSGPGKKAGLYDLPKVNRVRALHISDRRLFHKISTRQEKTYFLGPTK